MNHIKIIFISTVLLGLSTILNAQNNCPQVLKKARTTYDEGRISEVSGILEPCLNDKNGFSKEERIEAYKILVLTWLYFNERSKAEENMYAFLKLNPEYKINEVVDPVEFINLYNRFRTSPVLIWGVRLGFNKQDIHVLRNFSVDNSAVTRGTYHSALGIQVGLVFEIPIKKRWSLLTELELVRKKYSYSDRILNFAKINFQEKQTCLEVPILLHRNLSNKKFMPYINFGGTFGFLVGDKALVVRKDEINGNQVEVSGPELKITMLRHKILYAASMGFGFKIKDIIGNGYILVDFKYNLGLRNSVKPENRVSNTALVYNYLYIDNDFRMNSFVFSVGFGLPKYKPKLME